MKIFVETERLILREIVAEDFNDFYELDVDPDVHRYLGNKPVQNVEQSKSMIAHVRRQYQENGIGRWAIIEKGTNSFVGWTGLKYEQGLIDKKERYYDLGYRLKKKHWGKGFATESAIASLKYGFDELNLKEICAAAHTENIASNKILQKVGLNFQQVFTYDGAEHNWYKIERSDWIARD